MIVILGGRAICSGRDRSDAVHRHSEVLRVANELRLYFVLSWC